ncbi:FkbM family methyltransferase [Jiella pacifica]|uniref:FkbM family methyltransferase n=1 Tax=Jiella pacifica TaxID=2696469 RepID=A0A6N9SZ45_9HYPH|nr:FkbM family methyltransferase [Jiella pacifica]NDW04373.1 FkbM family methyltransferase [Jiella pacifica]
MYNSFMWGAPSASRNEILRSYEPIQPFLLLELSKHLAIDTFIDVGANIGTYSLFLSRLAGVGAIHAFEPNGKSFEELGRNIVLNGLAQKVHTHRLAASSTSGQAVFQVVGDYSGANGIKSTSIHAAGIAESVVECVTLDSMLDAFGERIGLKIDVEGHELEVLRGARQVLTTRKALLQIENYQSDGDDVAGFLGDAGYERITRVGPDHYYTNMAERPTDAELVAMFEEAARAAIAANLEPGGATARINLSSGVALEFAGGAARFLRTVKRRLRG